MGTWDFETGFKMGSICEKSEQKEKHTHREREREREEMSI